MPPERTRRWFCRAILAETKYRLEITARGLQRESEALDAEVPRLRPPRSGVWISVPTADWSSAKQPQPP